MAGRNEYPGLSKPSLIKALAMFTEIYPSIPLEQKKIMKRVLLPCFDLWFKIREKVIQSLLEWAEEADKTQNECGDFVRNADAVVLSSRAIGMLGSVFNVISQGVSITIQAASNLASVFSAGVKSKELIEINRIIDKVKYALENDRIESESLEKLVNKYFNLDSPKAFEALNILVESVQNDVFNSVVDTTTLNYLNSTYENYTADKAGSFQMLNACFLVLNQVETNEHVDKDIREKLSAFLNDNKVIIDVLKLCTVEAGELFLQYYADSVLLPDLGPSYLGVALQSAFLSHKIKQMLEYSSRPKLSAEIRELVDELKRVKEMFKKICDIIQDMCDEV